MRFKEKSPVNDIAMLLKSNGLVNFFFYYGRLFVAAFFFVFKNQIKPIVCQNRLSIAA